MVFDFIELLCYRMIGKRSNNIDLSIIATTL